jgi:hypothetical protein
MAVGKHVEIPLALLKSLVTLLEYWDISLFDRSIRDDYWDALWSLKLKLLKLDLHDAYSRIVKAPNDDARHKARMDYLQLKNQFDAIVAES